MHMHLHMNHIEPPYTIGKFCMPLIATYTIHVHAVLVTTKKKNRCIEDTRQL
jgi:hypothetical protein